MKRAAQHRVIAALSIALTAAVTGCSATAAKTSPATHLAAPVAMPLTAPGNHTPTTTPTSTPPSPSIPDTTSVGSSAPVPARSPSTAGPGAAASPPASPAVNPSKVVPAAWLAATQLPDAARLGWKAAGPQQVDTDWAHIGGPRSTPWCRGLQPPVAEQVLTFTGTGGVTAVQWQFFYTSPQAAQQAYQALLSRQQGCQAMTRSEQTDFGAPADAVITQTATVPGGTAWSRHWTGVQSPAGDRAGTQTDHEYAAQHGTVLTVADYDEGPTPAITATPYDTAGDTAILHALATGLNAYDHNTHS